MVALGNINEWHPPHGPVTMWMAAPDAREAAAPHGEATWRRVTNRINTSGPPTKARP